MIYEYTAYTVDRRTVKGTIEGASEAVAEEALYKAGYERVLTLTEARQKSSIHQLMPSLFGVKTQDVIDFSRELAAMIESGISILNALQLLEDQSPKPAFRKIITSLINDLREGGSFSAAVSAYPQVFSRTYCQVMKASEQSGNLEAGLRHIANYIEKQANTKKKIKSALAYPTIVAVMGIGVSVVLLTVALPPLIGMFDTVGAELPLITKILIGISDFLVDFKFQILGVIVILVGLIGFGVRVPRGKLFIDKTLLRLPVVGTIILQRSMHNFSHTAAMLLGAGLQLPEIMETVIPATGNQVIREAMIDLRERLVQGQGLSQPMAVIGVFPKLFIEMVAVGEKTGDLETMLSSISERYENSVDQRIAGLVRMIEPAMTLISGLLIGFIAISFIGPLYSLAGEIG